MQGLIEKIAEIDEETLRIAESAEAEKKKIEKEMKQKTADYDRELERETEAKIEETRKELSQ